MDTESEDDMNATRTQYCVVQAQNMNAPSEVIVATFSKAKDAQKYVKQNKPAWGIYRVRAPY